MLVRGEAGQVTAQVLWTRTGNTLVEDQHRRHELAPLIVGQAHDRQVLDPGNAAQRLLHLDWSDPLRTRPDELASYKALAKEVILVLSAFFCNRNFKYCWMGLRTAYSVPNQF